jgi:hypothetical protein
MQHCNALARVRGIICYGAHLFYVHVLAYYLTVIAVSSAILWHKAFGYKRTLIFDFFVYFYQKLFVFIFMVSDVSFRADTTRWLYRLDSRISSMANRGKLPLNLFCRNIFNVLCILLSHYNKKNAKSQSR